MAAKKVDRAVAGGQKWKRVQAPRPWRPKNVGDELVGFYVGTRIKQGRFGSYEIVLIKPLKGEEDQTFTVSGAVISTLFSAANLDPIKRPIIRLVWQGLRTSHMGENQYKDFDLFVADEPVMHSSRAHQG